MKRTMLFLAIFVALGACKNGTDNTNTNTSADNAVLVKDTANTLNAKPVKDTTVTKLPQQ